MNDFSETPVAKRHPRYVLRLPFVLGLRSRRPRFKFGAATITRLRTLSNGFNLEVIPECYTESADK